MRGNINSRETIPAVTSNTGNFFQRLNFKTGLYFDMPTEVMFEIAQRAGATTAYSWGDSYDVLTNYCICSENNGGGTQASKNATSAVGSKLPNNWGFYDTAGNVWEWCRDFNKSLPQLANVTDALARQLLRRPMAHSVHRTDILRPTARAGTEASACPMSSKIDRTGGVTT